MSRTCMAGRALACMRAKRLACHDIGPRPLPLHLPQPARNSPARCAGAPFPSTPLTGKPSHHRPATPSRYNLILFCARDAVQVLSFFALALTAGCLSITASFPPVLAKSPSVLASLAVLHLDLTPQRYLPATSCFPLPQAVWVGHATVLVQVSAKHPLHRHVPAHCLLQYRNASWCLGLVWYRWESSRH